MATNGNINISEDTRTTVMPNTAMDGIWMISGFCLNDSSMLKSITLRTGLYMSATSPLRGISYSTFKQKGRVQ